MNLYFNIVKMCI